MDDNRAFRRRSLAEQTAGLPLLDLPAPSVPTATSEDAADARSLSKRQRDYALVLKALLRVHPVPVSRDWLHAATQIPVATLCAILSDGELRGLYIVRESGACNSSAKANLKVDGYRLNPSGLARARALP